ALAPEQAGRPDHQDDHHHHEYDGVRSLGIEVLGQALDDAEPEAGQNRSHDRPHAADHDDGEDDDDQVGAHQRVDLVDRRGHHAGEGRQAYAKAEGQRDHPGYIHAERLHQRRVLGRRAQVAAELGALDDVPGREAYDQRCDDDPAAVDRQEHETEVYAAG